MSDAQIEILLWLECKKDLLKRKHFCQCNHVRSQMREQVYVRGTSLVKVCSHGAVLDGKGVNLGFEGHEERLHPGVGLRTKKETQAKKQ